MSNIGPDGYVLNECVSFDLYNAPRSTMKLTMLNRNQAHAGCIVSFRNGKYAIVDSNGYRFRMRRADMSAPKVMDVFFKTNGHADAILARVMARGRNDD